jgi:hypothetical protein
MRPVLEIPVKRIVKAYYLHESNIGPDLVINARSEYGRIIGLHASFLPADTHERAVKRRMRSEQLVVMRVETTFDVNLDLMSMHHLYCIGDAFEALFEREFYAFCVGRYQKVPSFNAAVEDFFTIYSLRAFDLHPDNFRRAMDRKLGNKLQTLYNKNLAIRKRMTAEEKVNFWSH